MEGLTAALVLLTAAVDPSQWDEVYPSAVPEDVAAFYQAHGPRPAWTDADGPVPAADGLVAAVEDALTHGLRPEYYRHRDLVAALNAVRGRTPEELQEAQLAVARVEALFTTTFLRLAADLQTGRLDADEHHPVWGLRRTFRDPVEILLETLPDGDSRQVLAGLAPDDPGYRGLREALVRDQRIRDEYRAHGWEVDEALQQRIDRLKVNLERHRWLPRSRPRREIQVELTDFRLRSVENGETAFEMPIVIGQPRRATPNFSHRMESIVFSPYWEVPHTIAIWDLLPVFRADPGQVVERRFTVLKPPDERGVEVEVDPADVDWTVPPLSFDYRLRQAPHPTNPMGQAKFLFPNRFFVNIHDTPDRHLLDAEVRAFSAGCIRIRRPSLLASWLLEPQRMDTMEIRGLLNRDEEIEVRVRERTPIHILYRTAWVDEHGVIQYRDDVYGWDAKLLARLQGSTPGTGGAPEDEPRSDSGGC